MLNNKAKILVTGGAGYIGSQMVLKLLEKNYQPIVVDDLSKGIKSRLPSNVPLYVFNIADENKLSALFETEKIDVVMHFSALIEVGESIKAPFKYYSTNFFNTLVLLNVMKKHNVHRIIFSSTAAVFGEPFYTPVDEKHVTNPKSPYGRSKLMCEQALKDFEIAYGIRSVCLRYFNAAGADPQGRTGFCLNDASNLIPIVLKAIVHGDCVKIFGKDYETADGTCIRDYIHVVDLCEAHLLAMEYLNDGGNSCVFNLGNGVGYSVRQVIDMIKKITQKLITVVDSPRRIGDAAVVIADSSHIQKSLGWKPAYSDLDTIVTHAWRWVSKT